MKEVLDEMFESVQDYVETNLMVTLDERKEEITPYFSLGGRKVMDLDSYEDTKETYRHVLTLVMTKMTVDYCNKPHFQNTEEKTIKEIFYKYNVDLQSAIVREGLTYTNELLDTLLAEMILELPFTYANASFKNNKVYESFIEEVMHAYEPFILFLNAE